MTQKIRRVRVTDIDREMAVHLRRLREGSRLTQSDVADYLGVKYQSYQRLEGGKATFKADTISRLARLFGVGPQFFFGNFSQMTVGWSPETAQAAIIMCRTPFEDRPAVLAAMVKARHD